MTEQACTIDLKKVFDSIDHENLLEKFENYGFSGKINELLRSFLSDREQNVSMNDLEIEQLSIKVGDPQGSVLGPLVFLLYIDDLPYVSDNSEITMFADDTTKIQSGKGTQCMLSSEMKPVCHWFSSSILTNNPAKCEALCFGHGKREKIKKLFAELDYKAFYKYLGVHVHKKLIFQEHIG